MGEIIERALNRLQLRSAPPAHRHRHRTPQKIPARARLTALDRLAAPLS
ncbi:MAG: hypothetical protein MUC60_16275 [Oscillatoria sp. Prado101]|nr:hypothetical protein [Oscillatoria sp. Prado101]